MNAADDPQELLTEVRRVALARLGYPEVPELLPPLLAALARGHHVVLLAAEGSGKETVYAIAAGVTCDSGLPEVQAVVVTPTREEARRAARAALMLNEEAGIEAVVWPPETAPEDELPERPVAHMLAGRSSDLLREVRLGRLSLAHLRLLVVDGWEAISYTGGWPATEALLDALGGGGQKILSARAPSDELERLLESRFPRARRWPAELLPARSEAAESRGRAPESPPLLYAAGADEEARLHLLVTGLRRLAHEHPQGPLFVHCGGADLAHRAAAALAAGSLRIAAEPGERGVIVSWGDDEDPPSGGVRVVLGLPASLSALRRWLEGGTARLAVVELRHTAQLELLARRAGWEAHELGGADGELERDAVDRFRAGVHAEIEATDAGSELLLLEPLLQEHGPLRVVAALARLLRRKGEAPRGTIGKGSPRGQPAEDVSVRPAWTRIFVNVGKKDGAGPGDLVGAITGETPATGAQIGKIDVRSTFSLVDVESQIADEVIRGLRGKTIRNREIVARPDRSR